MALTDLLRYVARRIFVTLKTAERNGQGQNCLYFVLKETSPHKSFNFLMLPGAFQPDAHVPQIKNWLLFESRGFAGVSLKKKK